MRDRPLSASSIKTYLQCVLKYYFRYEDKKPRQEKTDPLSFGIAVHSALEEAHKLVKEKGSKPEAPDYEKIIKVYMDTAAANGLNDLSLYQEGKDMVINRLDNIDPEEKIVGLELDFLLETPNGTPFLGSIDKLVELDEETAVVVDYKTSRTALSQPQADSDIQLSMYDLAVSMMYPQYKTIICVFDYLRLSEVVTHRTPEQRETFTQFLDAIHSDILNYEKEEVKGSLNPFCPWCDFKSFCEDYKTLLEDPNLVIPPLGEYTDEQFVDIWELTSSAKNIVNRRQRELKEEVYERMKNNDTISGDDKEIYKVQKSRMNYDTKAVFDVVGPEKFVSMSSVNKTAVDRFLRDNPEYKQHLTDTASFSFISPSFRTRKKKE